MIKVFNFYYFLILIILSIIFVLLYFLLSSFKDINKIKRFLLIWAFINFSIHFLKQFVYMDINFLHKSTLENICAITTVILPFVYLSKKQNIFTDFIYFIGVLGGFLGLIYPTEAIDNKIFCFETIRFYFCHFTIFIIPLFFSIFNIFRPRFKYFYLIPLVFLLYELIICINTAILTFSHLVTIEGYTAFELFLDKEYMNNSFTFGPTSDMGKLGEFIGSLCPNFMKIDILNINNGKLTYWPVIWLLFPSYVLLIPLYLLFSFPFFDYKK